MSVFLALSDKRDTLIGAQAAIMVLEETIAKCQLAANNQSEKITILKGEVKGMAQKLEALTRVNRELSVKQ